jgi:hypothetical protein
MGDWIAYIASDLHFPFATAPTCVIGVDWSQGPIVTSVEAVFGRPQDLC